MCLDMDLNEPCGNCGVSRANCSCENLWTKLKNYEFKCIRKI